MNIFERFKEHMFNSNSLEEDSDELEKEEKFINDILPNLEFGDVIWAFRYDFDWDKDEMGMHTNGPYIVIGKDNNKIIGMYCTSVDNKKDFFEIDKDDSVFVKPTFATTTKIKAIDYKSFLNINANKSLNARNKALVAKKLSLLPTIEYDDLGVTKSIIIDLSDYAKLYPGDIVQNRRTNSVKLVINFDGRYIHTMSIENCFDFNSVIIEHPNKYDYISTLSNEQIELIEEKYNNYKKDKATKPIQNNIQRGTLLLKNTNYYYVYNVEKQKVQMFQVRKTDYKTENTITIDHNYFIPNYDNDFEIYIKDKSYSIIGNANEIEAEFISNHRRSYNKTKKEKTNNGNNTSQPKTKHFKIGDIIRSKNIFAMEFIVIGIYKGIIITISKSAFNDGNIIYREFNENDDSLSKCGTIENSGLTNKYDYFTSLGDEVINAKELRLRKKLS